MLLRRVLFSGPGPDAFSGARTAILAAGAEPTLAAAPDEAGRALEGEPEAFDAVVLYLAPDDPGDRWEELLERVDRLYPRTQLLLLVSGDIAPRVEWMSRWRAVSHLLSWRGEPQGEDELRVALAKLFANDPFGLSAYLGPGTAVHRRVVADSRDKGAYVRAVAELAHRFGLAPRLLELAETVTDELSTNAIFNAPVDAGGQPRYAALNRREAVALEPQERAELGYGCDGRTFGVSVQDPFGSLTRETVVKYLGRCLSQAPAELITETGGAGLGLYRVFQAISRFVINIRPGDRTETIGLIDVHRSIKEIKSLPKTLQIYVQEASK
jgi:hypothetical protein